MPPSKGSQGVRHDLSYWTTTWKERAFREESHNISGGLLASSGIRIIAPVPEACARHLPLCSEFHVSKKQTPPSPARGETLLGDQRREVLLPHLCFWWHAIMCCGPQKWVSILLTPNTLTAKSQISKKYGASKIFSFSLRHNYSTCCSLMDQPYFLGGGGTLRSCFS